MNRLTTRAPTATPGILPLVLILALQTHFEVYHGVARFRRKPLTHGDVSRVVRAKALFASHEEGYTVQFHRESLGRSIFSKSYRTEVQI